jgi:hypothetical protein
MESLARETFVVMLLAVAISQGLAEGGIGALSPAPMPPADAPASVFNAKLGKGPDDDAELFVNGSWSATLLASLDLQAVPGQSLTLASQPLLFTQAPDLSLSFLLYKKIFVEARVADDVTQAKYAAGYRGGKGELLREARIGNDGISFPALPFLSFGNGSYRSFGAAATIASEGFTGKAMVRYDQADRVVKRFVGSTEVVENVISPNTFTTGKYFMTRVAPAPNLVLFVKSVAGTYIADSGDRYRKLDPGEYSYSAVTGVASLTVPAATRVVAYYAGSGVDTDAVTITGVGACDLLYVPPPVPATGKLEPKLQILNRYAATASPISAEAFVRNPASGLRDSDFKARIDPAGFVEVTRNDADSPSGGLDYRQPFASSSYADMAWIYTTDFSVGVNTGPAPVFTRTVVVRSFSASATITIDKDFVAGSIEVTRDGLPSYSFSVNADTAVVTLAPPPSAAEEIGISYMKESSERKSGNLAGALGGFWDLGEGQNAWAALGASWSVPGSSFATNARPSPGSVNLTVGERDVQGAFTHNAAIAARYSRDDSTGTYRIEGMEVLGGYSTDFLPDSNTSLAGCSSVETAETQLSSLFPSLMYSLHADGAVQKALKIAAGLVAPTQPVVYYKVEATPPYASFKTLDFFAKFSSSVGLSLTLDDGAPSLNSSAQISLPAGSGNGAWRRYMFHYGNGDVKVYVQDSEGSAPTLLATTTPPVAPSISSTGSRLVITLTGLAASETAWVDEVLLEESVGRAAMLFQGQVVYD